MVIPGISGMVGALAGLVVVALTVVLVAVDEATPAGIAVLEEVASEQAARAEAKLAPRKALPTTFTKRRRGISGLPGSDQFSFLSEGFFFIILVPSFIE
jgi:hypothetical protein